MSNNENCFLLNFLACLSVVFLLFDETPGELYEKQKKDLLQGKRGLDMKIKER